MSIKFSRKKIEKIVKILKNFYLFLFLVGVILLVSVWLLGRILIFTGLLGIVISASIYYGLKHKQAWVVSIIVYLAGFGFLSQLFYSPDNLINLIVKIFAISLAVFEIYFFTRKDVKKYFNIKSVFLFGR